MKRFIFLMMALCLITPTITATGKPEVPIEKPEKLVVWCNTVHESVTNGTSRGGANLTAEFEKLYDVKIEWVPLAWDQMLEKIQLELTVSQGEPDVVFAVVDWATPAFLESFIDLSPYLKKNPIENMEDFSLGGINAFTLQGGLRFVPYRSNVQLMHYNKDLFDMYGLKEPKTMEELGEAAKKMTHTRADGAKVYGLAFIGSQTPLEIIRAFGGDVVDSDGKYVLNSSETRKAIAFMKDLYVAGAIPPNFESLTSANSRQLYVNGLIGMMFQGDNYYYQLNDSTKSGVAGKSWFASIPPSQDKSQQPGNVKLALWGAGIPKNAKKNTNDMAYEFIKFFTSRTNQLEMALNGNSPSRSIVYENEEYIKLAPYAEASLSSSPYAYPLIPAVNGIAEVMDAALEEISRAITGSKTIENALSDASKKILSILKREGIPQ